jgi:hypothetical protein
MESYARLVGSTPEKTAEVLAELEAGGVCDTSRSDNGLVTLRNRRMARYDKEREQNRLRQERWRVTQQDNGKITQPKEKVTPPSSSSSSIHKNNPTPMLELKASLSGPNSKQEADAAIERVWQHYIQKLGKNPRLLEFTRLRREKGLARLREAYRKTGADLVKAEGLLCLAINAMAASEFHNGSNDRSKAFDSWEKNLFPSQEKMEWWIERAN